MFFKTLYLSVLLIISQALIANDCYFDCWNKVYLQGGQLTCNETVVLEDNFNGNALNNSIWQTFFFDEDYRYAKIHSPVEEVFYLDENVSIQNGTCVLTGLYAPNSTYTNSREKLISGTYPAV